MSPKPRKRSMRWASESSAVVNSSDYTATAQAVSPAKSFCVRTDTHTIPFGLPSTNCYFPNTSRVRLYHSSLFSGMPSMLLESTPTSTPMNILETGWKSTKASIKTNMPTSVKDRTARRIHKTRVLLCQTQTRNPPQKRE